MVLALAKGACKKTEPITKPNIVYILTDQWRASAWVMPERRQGFDYWKALE